MIEFGFVPFHWIWGELEPNVARYHAEMTDPDDYGTPEVDWDLYNTESKLGRCRVVTVRDDGQLVGFSIFAIGTNPRYRNRIEADNHGLFLEKKYRGSLGRVLTKKSDEYLEAMGVHETTYTESDSRMGGILPGYQPKYTVWTKQYGKQS